jgi:predicted nucleotide-binding protein (sugar kinase/HSP70/actin superfamily)
LRCKIQLKRAYGIDRQQNLNHVGLFSFIKRVNNMTEQEQYERLAAGFEKLDNYRRDSLDKYTQALVKTCSSGEKAALTQAALAYAPGEKGPVVLQGKAKR